MDIDSILDDDLDIQILEVNSSNESVPKENLPTTKKETLRNNPVEEHLIKQLNCVNNQIRQTKNNIDLIDCVTNKILKDLSTQTAYREEISSESDNDLYSSTGEPIIKSKRNKHFARKRVIKVENIWQRIIDDKWIIGFNLKSTTTCVLKDPTLYFCPRDIDEDCHGVSVFWTLIDDTFWYPTDEIDSEESLMATVTFDLPSFDCESSVKAQGLICCQFDDKIFQSEVVSIELDIEDLAVGTWILNFNNLNQAERSILALKALAVESLVILPLQSDSNIGRRLMKFLDEYGFAEVCKICLVKNPGSLQYCIIEILPTEDADVKVLISARSKVQLSLVMRLMQEHFPEILDVEKLQSIEEAAETLREELQLYLTCNDPSMLQQARINSDLLIP